MIRKKFFSFSSLMLVLFILCLSYLVQANSPPEAQWERVFSGEYDKDLAPILQTMDGGFLVGCADSLGNKLIKIDNIGEPVWNHTYDGTFISINQADDNYVLAGHKLEINEFNLSNSYYIIKLVKIDSVGDKLWEKSYSKNNYIIESTSACKTSDEGYVIVGKIVEIDNSNPYAISDIWLVKTDSNGELEWDTTYGGRWNDSIYQIIQTEDRGYIMIGSTDSYGTTSSDEYSRDNVWLIKIDENGNEEWNKTFGGEEEDIGYSIQEINDGYIISGMTYSYGSCLGDVWLIKTDYMGDEIYNKTYHRKSNDRGYYVSQLSDEGYVIVGVSYYSNGDIWLIKTDSKGDIIWDKTYGTNDNDRGFFVSQTKDGGYIVSGRTYPDLTSADIVLFKINGDVVNQYPVAQIVTNYSGGLVDIVFDASSSYDTDGDLEYYRWDWNNDGIWDTKWLSSPIIEYNYGQKGKYNITLEVKDKDGGTNTTSITLEITKNSNSLENKKSDDTPGFEFVLILFTIFIMISIYKRFN